MTRPIQLLIHQQALQHNLKQIRSQIKAKQRLFVVVKANAYGHGLTTVYNSISNADGLATLELESAKQLRELGWNKPILLLEGFFSEQELVLGQQLNVWPVIHNQQQIDWLTNAKLNFSKVFLKLNSGMNRLGFSAQQYLTAHQELVKIKQVESIAYMTHFSDADSVDSLADDNSKTQQQVKQFTKLTANLIGEKTISNSIAILKQIDQKLKLTTDWVRVGYAFYGGCADYPQHQIMDWNLQPTQTLAAQIIAIQNLTAGQATGYGSIFIASKNMRIGLVACGYADGYPRLCANKASVLINGKRSKVVGQVSMDILAIDLTEHPQANIGCWVTLWGRDKTLYQQAIANGTNINEVPVLSIDEVAQHAQTIGYELMCQVANRVPKYLVD